ncbi:CdaR family transcriptional regulator [Halalkalibacter krulwichiae]|uniref:Carbohydrate diacid regulator n=1 Tax=Halalkalibacter krulwichiae TaxID=199441 RepID=A0A1X9M779_9BACI|nr:sugar diacid recognition domain-containing protein [Halalkalibacter krulwichiae]ARK29278.1 Carbohydrate diacid regulator [Halalkalibacter krulwichiae]
MRLLKHVAQRIVNEVSKVIEEEVIVINTEGIIIASNDTSRVGFFHEGGKEVVKHKKKLIITENELKRLKGVKIGLNLPIRFQDHVIGVIGITGSQASTVRYGELIQRLTELIIQESYAAERLDSKLRGFETYVYEWLHTETFSDEFKEQGEILGIHMNEGRYCVLIQLEKDEDVFPASGIEHDVLERIRSFLPNESSDVVVRWGNDRFVLLLSSILHNEKEIHHLLLRLSSQLEQAYSTTVKAGISLKHDHPSTLHLAYREASQALNVKNSKLKIIFYDSLTLEIALGEISLETRAKIVKEVLGRLMEEPELLETLQSYFHHQLSVKEAAASLHIHINTLHYRLKRIQELTGMQLKETKELVTMFIALWYLQE